MDAIRTIAAALGDEDLHLITGDNARSRIFATRESGPYGPIDRYHVPTWRIVPRTLAPEDMGMAPGELQEVYGK